MISGKPYYREALLDNFERIRKKRKSYSLRSYAKDLDILAPTLSNVLRGKRSLSFYAAIKAVEHLKLNPTQRAAFIESVLGDKKQNSSISKSNASLKKALVLKSSIHDEFVSDPIYFSVLSYLNTDKGDKSSKGIARAFSVSQLKVGHVVTRLLEAGLLRLKGGELVLTTSAFSSTDNIPSEAIRKAHRATLNSALKKLDEVSIKHRDYRSLKMPFSKSSMPLVKKEMKLFMEKIYRIASKEKDKDEVYELALQFFPQTQVKDDL
ncbi:MAG: DUF4423 domain-containing protein [Bdellovibrionota bacterium]